MRSASVLLVITAVGFAATAVFRTSNSGIVTPGIVIHRIAVITITVAFPVACFLMVRALRSDARWRDMTGYYCSSIRASSSRWAPIRTDRTSFSASATALDLVSSMTSWDWRSASSVSFS